MKLTYRLWFFDPMDADGIEAYLNKMARKGWQLEKAGWWFWRFRRAEPAPLTYAVTYFPGSSFYGGATTDAQDELAEYCAAAGWDYVTQMLRMQVFVNSRPDPVPLETSGLQKLEAVEAILKKDSRRRKIFLILLIFLAYLVVRTAVNSPLSLLTDPILLGIAAASPFLLLAMGVRLLLRTLWLRRSWQLVVKGQPCAPTIRYFRLPRWLLILSVAVYALLLLWGLLYSQTGDIPQRLFRRLVGTILSLGTLWWMRERGFGEKGIFWIPLLAAGLVFLILYPSMVQGPYPAGEAPVPKPSGQEEPLLSDDPVPLSLDDLGIDSLGLPISEKIQEDTASPLASLLRCRLTSPQAETQSAPRLFYTIVHTRFPAVDAFCLRDPDLLDESLVPVDDDGWQAQAVYADRPNRNLLICWEGAMLRLSANKSIQLTDQQKQAVRQMVMAAGEGAAP